MTLPLPARRPSWLFVGLALCWLAMAMLASLWVLQTEREQMQDAVRRQLAGMLNARHQELDQLQRQGKALLSLLTQARQGGQTRLQPYFQRYLDDYPAIQGVALLEGKDEQGRHLTVVRTFPEQTSMPPLTLPGLQDSLMRYGSFERLQAGRMALLPWKLADGREQWLLLIPDGQRSLLAVWLLPARWLVAQAADRPLTVLPRSGTPVKVAGGWLAAIRVNGHLEFGTVSLPVQAVYQPVWQDYLTWRGAITALALVLSCMVGVIGALHTRARRMQGREAGQQHRQQLAAMTRQYERDRSAVRQAS